MKATNKLSDTVIRNAKPAQKAIRLFDGGGMYLEVSPSGGKLWRMQYRYDGKGKLLSFGAYPYVSLKEARDRREEAKTLLAHGTDPSEVKKAQKAAKEAVRTNSFEAVAREWFKTWGADKAESHYNKIIARLEKDIFPWLGKRPIAEIDAPEILEVLRKITSRGTIETAHRAKCNISQIMRFAIATGRRRERDPVPDLKGALPSHTGKHMAAILDPVKVGELLRAIAGYQGQPPVIAALKLAPLVFVRPGELRAAKWSDIDLDEAEWTFTMPKTKTPHIVPLARQAVEILRELHVLTGGGEWVFPGLRPVRPISNNTLNAALRRMGYNTQTDMTAHGFRSTAQTLLSSELEKPFDWTNRQLGHKHAGVLKDAYQRAQYLAQRRQMMQEWADYLDQLREGAAVIPLRA